MYENLLKEADENGIITKEKKMNGHDGLWYDNRIAVHSSLTEKEKTCVLAEELGHYNLTVGNVLDQSNVCNRKQEKKARIYAYNKLVGISGIIKAFEHNCLSLSEMAEYLDITEEFLSDAITYYQTKYDVYTKLDNYIIYFTPSLTVVKLFE